MKKLLTVASVALMGVAFVAEGAFPRVYQYKASLKTAVATNASKVTYKDEDGDKWIEEDVCYRKTGKVSLKGAFLFACDCVDMGEYEDGVLLSFMGTSADKYEHVYLESPDADVEELESWFYLANRLGSPDGLKAKKAEMAFDVLIDPDDDCDRGFELWHAGFGSAKALDSNNKKSLDITTISGYVTGVADAPICSALDNNCPRCLDDGDCELAIAFAPCEDWDNFGGGDGLDFGVAYGSFSLKYSSSLSKSIYQVPEEDVQGTLDILVPKVLGKNAVVPVIPVVVIPEV